MIDLSGRVVSGKNKPSGEMFTHLAVYNSRPDVKAVVHAHLPHVTALSVAGIKLDKAVLPETFVMMGNISTASYATPSSYEGAAAIKKVIKNSNAVILDRHGAMAFGSSLNEAYNRLEKLEHTAKVAALAKMMGRVKYLNRHQVKKLKELKGKLYGTKR